jgi:hypothetical protein
MITRQEVHSPAEWMPSMANPPQPFLWGGQGQFTCSDILLTLKTLHYAGDHKNFNLNKYCTAHVEQHNWHATCAEFNVAALEESTKIHHFEDGITDLSFNSVNSTIMVDCQKFKEFVAVMQLYANFKGSQKPEALTH